MAASPPCEFSQAIVGASRSVRQSHRTFPAWGVLVRMARWPMANLGVVVRDQMSESPWSLGEIGDQVLVCLSASWEREVHAWPVGGTYWRGSC